MRVNCFSFNSSLLKARKRKLFLVNLQDPFSMMPFELTQIFVKTNWLDTYRSETETFGQINQS